MFLTDFEVLGYLIKLSSLSLYIVRNSGKPVVNVKTFEVYISNKYRENEELKLPKSMLIAIGFPNHRHAH